jgi:hypothetical protein
MASIDDVLECVLRPGVPAMERICWRISGGKQDLTCESSRRKRPSRNATFKEFLGEVAWCEKETGDRVAA